MSCLAFCLAYYQVACLCHYKLWAAWVSLPFVLLASCSGSSLLSTLFSFGIDWCGSWSFRCGIISATCNISDVFAPEDRHSNAGTKPWSSAYYCTDCISCTSPQLLTIDLSTWPVTCFIVTQLWFLYDFGAIGFCCFRASAVSGSEVGWALCQEKLKWFVTIMLPLIQAFHKSWQAVLSELLQEVYIHNVSFSSF